MTEDDQIRDELNEAIDSVGQPRLSLTTAMRSGARRRWVRRGSLALGAAVIALPTGLWTLDTVRDRPRVAPAALQPPAPRESPGWTHYRDDQNGYSVSYPSSWNRATEVLTPALESPRELLVVGTAAMVPDGEKCAQYPENAMEAMGPSDVLMSIQEPATPFGGSFGMDRPDRFRLSDGSASTDITECLPESYASYSGRMIPFIDGGRSFYAVVVLGPSVSDDTKDDLLAVLDSLEFE